MDIILPYNLQDREELLEALTGIGFDEFVAIKYIFIMFDADLDVFELMCDQRLSVLIYGWDICHQRLMQLGVEDASILPKKMEMVMKHLLHQSLELWFAKEWDTCALNRRNTLLHLLKRAKNWLVKIPGIPSLKLDYMIEFDLKPWRVTYLNRFFGIMEQQSSDFAEHEQSLPTEEDIKFLETEGLPIILLRLVKIIDAGSTGTVRRMAITLASTWNAVDCMQQLNNGGRSVVIDDELKRCLLLLCHIFLIAEYELDDNRGFVIDNMMNNIRFYCRSMRSADGSVNNLHNQLNTSQTPARQIARICLRLGMSSNDFFRWLIFEAFDEACFYTRFGVISHAYLSYVLGNMLMDMNNMSEEDFVGHLADFKRYLSIYVVERERSEMFMLDELKKQELQKRSPVVPKTVPNILAFQSKFCKGNRLSNIGNYENAEEAEKTIEMNALPDYERRIDPVFQNLPNNADILNYVYKVLAERTYTGWRFAKLVLLLKIIGFELNEIETWRYHSGLTTDFMLNLEIKLSRHYEDFAKIFEDHQFLAQEFWLTAFYLNPTEEYYVAVLRCGSRLYRKRHTDASEEPVVKAGGEAEKTEKASISSPFGLLSSTIDVQEIIGIMHMDSPDIDYEPLRRMLRSLNLPQNVVKDLITVCFLPRNKSYAWAVNWNDLRKRCRALLKNPARKRHLVELNMAEAIDRLKFLKIDYEKYKNRPQLDYGAIEEGYEGKLKLTQTHRYEHFDEEDDDDDDFDADDCEYLESSRRQAAKEKESNQENEIPDEFFAGTRRTRARTAAVMASAAIHKRLEAMKGIKIEPKEEEDFKEEESKSEATAELSTEADLLPPPANKRDLTEWLADNTTFRNSTHGFKDLPDIWHIEATDMRSVEESATLYFESGSSQLFNNFMNLKKQSGDGGGFGEQVTSCNKQDATKTGDEDTDSFVSDSSMQALLDTSDYRREYGTTEGAHSSMDDLIRECNKKKLAVSLQRLTAQDVAELRQPKVCLKRLSVEDCLEPPPKRSIRSRSGGFPIVVQSNQETVRSSSLPRLALHNDSDFSSKSSDSSHRPQRRKPGPKSVRVRLLQQMRHSSDSSTDAEECLQRYVVRRDQQNRLSLDGGAKQSRPANLITARSASGMRLRISSSTVDGSIVDPDTEKTLSIPSSPVLERPPQSSLSMVEEVFEPSHAGDPLYEQEINIRYKT